MAYHEGDFSFYCSEYEPLTVVDSGRGGCLFLPCLSLHFNSHFPREPGLAGVYWSKGWWRWCWQLDYRNYKLCKATGSNNHHRQTNIQFFYRPDALPVAQPTVSKHWRDLPNFVSGH